jgi:ribonucleoside-diphosphate reductase alpha chain
LPYHGGTYKQTPFEDCTKEVYEEMMLKLKDIDLSKVIEIQDNTNFSESVACGPAGCEIT